jgi:hypothetical protein
MTVLRGLIGVLVGLAVSVGFVQFLELMLANALAGRPLQSMAEYAAVLNTLPVLAVRVVVASFVSLLGGYLCAKLAEADEMRYTLIAVIFPHRRHRWWKYRGLYPTHAGVGAGAHLDGIHGLRCSPAAEFVRQAAATTRTMPANRGDASPQRNTTGDTA